MTENPDLLRQIDTYTRVVDSRRARRVETFLASLTPRERSLVQDAAVMGYAHGVAHERHKDVPPDPQIVRQVVEECLYFPDRYPVLGGRVDHYPALPSRPEPGTD